MQSKSTKIDPALFVAPALLLFSAGCGLALCAMIHANPHPREILTAFATILISITAAAIPLFLARQSDQTIAAQAALIATIIHLFVAIALAGFAILILKVDQTFTYWLFPFYWTTLIGLAIAAARLVKSAPTTASPAKQ